MVTDVVDNVVIRRKLRLSVHESKTGLIRRRQRQHLCLDKGYNSEQEEQKLIKRGYVLHIPIKKKKKKGEKYDEQKPKAVANHKKYSPKRWVVYREREQTHDITDSENFTRYEKKSENYLGLVQLSCCIIIFRKIILG